MNWLEVYITKLMIGSLRRGYGADCETRDIDDFTDICTNIEVRCPSCRAKETIEFLEGHLDTIEWMRNSDKNIKK